MASPIVGKVLSDQYRVDRYIASGGMASVFQVWDLKRNVPLAMKVLQTDLAEDPVILKRFRREARAMQKLVHPNIVPFYGLLQAEDFYFLLQLFIDGPNLKDVLRKAPDHSLSVLDTLTFTKAIGAALGYAHANDVVHCDIKPGNIMVDRGGNIYLADFGIARHADSTTTSMAGAGTAAYMAPEQIKEEPVSPRTDIYAMAIMIFEMLTGRRPFLGDETTIDSKDRTLSERLREAHLLQEPPKLSDVRPGLPEVLSGVLRKAMSKDQEDRFATMMEFFSALCVAAGFEANAIPDRIDLRVLDEFKPQVTSLESGVTPSVDVPKTSNFTQILKRYYWVLIGVVLIVALIIIIPGVSFSGGKSKKTDNAGASVGNGDSTNSLLTSTVAIVARIELSETPRPIATDLPTATATTIPTVTPFPYETKQNENDGAEMILIPVGEFEMGAFQGESPIAFWGAEQPRHKVFLDDYWIYRLEVTNEMYKQCVAARACPKPGSDSTNKYPDYYISEEYAKFPVVNVSWTGAVSYCVWARGRLPTEAEWEKAARGTDQRFLPWGNQPSGNTRANYCDINCTEDTRNRSIDDGYAEAAPVGSFPDGASFYGVLDMAGNVYEWVNDYFNAGFYQSSPLKNPKGPASSNTRVIRGGAYYSPIDSIQVVARYYHNPTRTMPYLGFRCAVNPTN